MTCYTLCQNTSIRVDRVTRTVVAGVANTSRSTVITTTPAYYEPQDSVIVDTTIGRKARKRAQIVTADLDIRELDYIIDLNDSNREYLIFSVRRFRGSHLEIVVEEHDSD